MKHKKRMICSIGTGTMGIILLLLHTFSQVDSWFAALGAGLAGAGFSRLVREILYHRNHAYARSMDIRYTDERLLYLSEKARSWTFVLSIIALTMAGIVLKVIHVDGYANLCLYMVCACLLIYSAAYVVLSRTK